MAGGRDGHARRRFRVLIKSSWPAVFGGSFRSPRSCKAGGEGTGTTPDTTGGYDEPHTDRSRSQWLVGQLDTTPQSKRAVERARRRGEITLLIDGLDHGLSQLGFDRSLRWLLTKSDWRGCPIWVAGRPYAFEQCWDSVFAGPEWRFLRVNPLNAPEIRFYLKREAGGDWYDLLTDSTDLLAVPRLLQLIACITRRALPAGAGEAECRAVVEALELWTPANVYSRAYFEYAEANHGQSDRCGLFAQGLVGDAANLGIGTRTPRPGNMKKRIRQAGALVGAIAFTLLASGRIRAETEPLLTALTRRSRKAKLTTATLQDNLDELGLMNAHAIDHLLFDDTGAIHWVFRDRTVRAFFAAHWAMKYGSPAGRTRIEDWIVDVEGDRRQEFTEFWQFAAQLPDGLIDRDRWHTTFDGSYTPPDVLDRRPIYRRTAAGCPRGPVRVGRLPVTNARYELFDPRHERWDKSLTDAQPVVNVTFWDAWACAVWLGFRFPNDDTLPLWRRGSHEPDELVRVVNRANGRAGSLRADQLATVRHARQWAGMVRLAL